MYCFQKSCAICVIFFICPFFHCVGQNILSSECYEQESSVLRSYKNRRIAEIESMWERMLLVPANTEDGAELWRGFLDFSRRSLICFPLDTYDKDDEDYWNRILSKTMQLFYICCDNLEGREKEAYNNALAFKNFLYYAYKNKGFEQTTWENIRDMLDDGDVAIELRALPEEALILKKGMNCPLSVPIDSLLADKLGAYKGDDAVEISEMYSHDGVLARLWNSISPYIHDAKRIYISASHFLCNFNYGAIPTENGSTVDKDYDFHYLVSTEDILAVKNRVLPAEYKTTAIFGDIDYDISAEMVPLAEQHANAQDPTWDLTRGMDEATRGKLLPLQHSKEEIAAISSLLRSRSVDVKMFDATAASEESLKETVSNRPEILHLSTHGFMLAPVYYDTLRTKTFLESQTASKYSTFLLKSGLLLSGASRVWNGDTPKEGREDGILTTKELLDMDFRGTKLVVLSACKSGLGNDTNLTGLSLGPQHALKVKGVEQIVMSLWMVDDAATALLMKYFYESLTDVGNARAALRYAQQKLIEAGYSDPYYWAAFVVLD